jgi:hypothetical protein
LKNTISLIYVLVLFYSGSVSGQIVFKSSVGLSDAEIIRFGCQTFDGGFLGAGSSSSFSSWNSAALLVRLDANGDTLWTQVYEHIISDAFAKCVLQTADSGFFVCGEIFGSAGMFLWRFDANGSMIWQKSVTFDNSSTYHVFLSNTHDGNFVVVADLGGWEFAVARFDTAGNALFKKKYEVPTGYTKVRSIHETAGGDFIVAGFTDLFGAGSHDALLVKIDSVGNMLWTKAYGGLQDEHAEEAVEIANGDFLIGGYTTSTGLGNKDMLLMKTDSNGFLKWARTYGAATNEYAVGVGQTMDGNYFLCGTGNNSWATFLKIDTSGYLIWDVTHQMISSYGYVQYAHQTADSGFICYGCAGVTGTENFIFIKTDVNGQMACIATNFHLTNANAAMTETDSAIFQVSIPSVNSNATSFTLKKGLNAYKTCFVVSVSAEEDGKSNSGVVAYPNPFSDGLILSAPSRSFTECKFTINNMMGQAVKVGNFVTNESIRNSSIDLNFLDVGVYLLEIFIDGERSIKKIVKQ